MNIGIMVDSTVWFDMEWSLFSLIIILKNTLIKKRKWVFQNVSTTICFIRLNSHVPQVCDCSAVIVWLCCGQYQPHVNHILVIDECFACHTVYVAPDHRPAEVASKKAMLVACGRYVVDMSHHVCWIRPQTSCNSMGDIDHILRLLSKLTSISGLCEYYHVLTSKFMTAHKLTTIL